MPLALSFAARCSGSGITFFVYAVAGMHLFSGIRQSNQYYLFKDANFEDFGKAFITLIRCSTGENWNGIM